MLTIQQTEQMFFTILRAHLGLAPRPESYELTETEWQKLLDYSQVQGLVAVIYHEIVSHKSNLPLHVKAQWVLKVVPCKQKSVKQHAALLRLRDLLAARSIELVLLKGEALALLYPHPELRSCNDIDFYTVGHFEEVNQLLLEQGATALPETGKHSSFLWEGVHLENHHKINDDDYNEVQESIARYLGPGIDRNHLSDPRLPGILLPDADTGALFLMVHMLRHAPSNEMTLRQIADWVVYLRRYGNSLDWGYLDRVWREARMEHFVGMVVRFCREYFRCDSFPLDYSNTYTEEEYRLVSEDILHGEPLPVRHSDSRYRQVRALTLNRLHFRRMYNVVYRERYYKYHRCFVFFFFLKKILKIGPVVREHAVE